MNPNLYDDTFKEINHLIKNVDYNDFNRVKEVYEKTQMLFWTNIQCDLNYNRSVSFVFINQLKNQPLSYHKEAFRNKFMSFLSDRLYNLDKKGIEYLYFVQCFWHTEIL